MTINELRKLRNNGAFLFVVMMAYAFLPLFSFPIRVAGLVLGFAGVVLSLYASDRIDDIQKEYNRVVKWRVEKMRMGRVLQGIPSPDEVVMEKKEPEIEVLNWLESKHGSLSEG